MSLATDPAQTLGELAADLAGTEDAVVEWAESGQWPSVTEDPSAMFPLQFERIHSVASRTVGDTTFSIVERGCATEPFDVRLVVEVQAGGISALRLRVGPDAASIADDLAAGFTVLLVDLDNLDRRVDSLPVLGDEESRRLVGEAAPTGQPPSDPVHVMFQRVAAAYAGSEAVVSAEHTFTYAELDALSDAVARQIREQGVTSGSTVAVDADRGAACVVAMIGVLKAGAAFLPVELDQPAGLVSEVLTDAGADLLLVPAQRADAVPAGVRYLDPLEAVVDATMSPPRKVRVRSADPAYVVYTSGSTGAPKGITVTHASLTHYVTSVASRLGFEPGWNHLTVASPAVDLGYTALFGALLTGGCFHTVDRGSLLDSDIYAQLVRERDIDCIKTTPSHVRTLMAAGLAADLWPRRLLILGGESLDDDLAGHLGVNADDRVLVNHYGPAEACVGVSVHVMRTDSAPAGSSETLIGTALGGNRLLVLDDALRPVPVGVEGEIYIGGHGVAVGYVGMPDLTAERFMPDPFTETPGARIYRTGDLGRWRPDGTLVFCGRVDEQIKIRGFRVEPAAVHRQLSHHPAVAQAVVVTCNRADGTAGLAAYVVPTRQRVAERAVDLRKRQVQVWTEVFENVYSTVDDSVARDPTQDLTGWNSSYTGQVMSLEEVRESVDGVVERVSTCASRRIMEVGCGTGLLLFRLAPYAGDYLATDISASVLERLRRGIAREPPRYGAVRLWQREAVDFAGIDDDSLDLLLLNSLIQYFPSIEYLLEVLREGVRVVRPGGHVFIGDVRDPRLLELLHLSVALHRSEGGETVADITQQARATAAEDIELMVAPEFFVAVRNEVSGIADVELELKRGRIANELTKFRYDVMLRVGSADGTEVQIEERRWAAGDATPREVVESFASSGRSGLLIVDVPDSRTAADIAAEQAVVAAAADADIAQVRLAGAAADGVAPEDWWGLAPHCGGRIAVQPARSGRQGCYDVLLTGADSAATWHHVLPTGTDLRSFCNVPYWRDLDRELRKELTDHLAGRLPEYAVPSPLVVVESIPMTASGKLDVNRLRVPDLRQVSGGEQYVAPRTPIEEIVAGIWQEVLGLPQVGIHDDFFRIGGHSLLAVQVVYRIGAEVGTRMPLREFFGRATIAKQAGWLADRLLHELKAF